MTTIGEAVLTLIREGRRCRCTQKGLGEVLKAIQAIDGLDASDALRILQGLEYVAHDNPTFGTKAGDAFKGFEKFQPKIDKLIGR